MLIKIALCAGGLMASAGFTPHETIHCDGGTETITSRWIDCNGNIRTMTASYPCDWSDRKKELALDNHRTRRVLVMRTWPEDGSVACSTPSRRIQDVENPGRVYSEDDFAGGPR